MSTMHNPPHPGRILKSTVLGEERGLSVQALADRLKMTRTAVSRVVNGKVGISIEMAIRLEALLGTSAETWVAMQADYDLCKAKQKRHPKIARLEVAA